LLQRIAVSWTDLITLLDGLSEAQRTELTDANGWTVKDHVIHLAVWEAAGLALLDGKSKRESLDIPPEIWAQYEDPINAVLHQRYHAMTWEDVIATLHDNHMQTLAKINAMSDADLARPHSDFLPGSAVDDPILIDLEIATCYHYDEHLPWIKAILGDDPHTG
jgi:hypothetical protein